MMRFTLTLLVCLQVHILFSKVDTLFVYSEVMDKSIPNLVITPENYQQTKEPSQFFIFFMAPVGILVIGCSGFLKLKNTPVIMESSLSVLMVIKQAGTLIVL